MHVASTTEAEIRLTIGAAIELVNELSAATGTRRERIARTRATLAAHEFSRVDAASTASLDRLVDRVSALAELLRSLPDLDDQLAARRVNEELIELSIAPAVVDHGQGPHLHWTAATAPFDDQVVADVLMALALELCESGTDRFGRCAATGCDDLFHDTTRNRSRRFCADPRCASRTHTADHRARRRSG